MIDNMIDTYYTKRMASILSGCYKKERYPKGTSLFFFTQWDTNRRFDLISVGQRGDFGLRPAQVAEIAAENTFNIKRKRAEPIALPFHLFCVKMLLQLLEGLVADVVFHPAGILGGHLGADPQLGEPQGEQSVPLVDALGDLQPLVRELNGPLLAHGDGSVLPEDLHSPADAGFGKVEMPGHVDGPHQALFLLQDQYGLQIVLARFLDLHVSASPRLSIKIV